MGTSGGSHVDKMMRVLEDATLRHKINNPYVMAAALVVIIVLFWFVIAPELGRDRPMLRLATLILAVVINPAITWWELRLLKRYETWVVERLQHSGIIETLALGFHNLPAIHDYAPFPWKFFLGPPPSSLQGGVKLLAYNLDWYLREPRTLVRPQWITYGVTMTVVPLVILVVIFDPLGIITTAGPDRVMPWVVGVMLGVIFPVSGVANHFQARQHIATRLLHDEMIRRMKG